PDWVAHRWQDERLVNGDIDNTERFLEAGENLYKKYQHYTKIWKQEINIPWSELREWFLDIFGKSNSGPANWDEEDRIKTYRKEYSWLGKFDEDDWFEDAIETEVRGLKDSKKGLASTFTIMRDKYFWQEDVDKEKTDWFRFQEAVKAHQALAMEYLKTTFDKMDIDLHRY
ncbi:MAG: hypothetical protein J7M38_14425, partial [Armatimonadetes bacterium]|nr:hypothetical protein [Armatimonadota bacterium]